MTRVNRLFASVYSFLLVGVVSEALVNGFLELENLNPVVFFLSAAGVIFLVIGFLVGHFVFDAPLVWFKLIPVFTLFLLVTWPLHFDVTMNVPDSFKPWIWWLFGASAIAAGATFKFWIGVSYITLVSVSWIALRTSPRGGSGELVLAIQDSVHLFVLASIGTAMVVALRYQASKTDFANQDLIDIGVRSAQHQAVDMERARLDALVHDRVLTTLLLASKAQTPDEIIAASKLANDAISRLDLSEENLETHKPVVQVSFFQALGDRITELYPEFMVAIERTNDSPVPDSVSEALTEATLQAVDNSHKHAGRDSTRKVLLQGREPGLKIVVSDNGKGFRPSKIARDRLGIEISIVGRIKEIGGQVFLRSAPGEGTDVVIEWSPNA